MTKNLKYALLTASVCALGATASAQSVQDAQRAVDLERYSDAKRMYQQLVKSSPSEENYFYLGDVYLQPEEQKLDSATIYFNKGLAQAKKNRSPLNYVGLGKVAMMRGNMAEAQQNFDEALKLSKSKDPKVLTEIAEAYLEAAKRFPNRNIDLKKAEEYAKMAISRDSRNDHARVVLGDVYLAQGGRAGDAISQYEQAFQINPKNAKSQLRIGQVYTRSRNYEGAQQALRNAIEIDPNYSLAYRDLGELYYFAKQYDLALENFRKYVSMSEQTPDTRATYASFLFLTENYDEALKEIRQFLQKNPNHTVMNRLRAYSLYETGKTDSALAAMNNYFKVAPKDKQIANDYMYYGKILAKGGKDSLALNNYEKAMQMDSSKTELFQDMAQLYLKQEQYDKAIEQYKKKIKKDGASNTDYYYLGRAYLMNRNFESADSMFALITKDNPTYPYGHLWRAQANANLDPESDKGLAKPHYEKFIELANEDKAKYKPQLVEANTYLGSYYLFIEKDNAKARKHWEEVKALDPNNPGANDALKQLNKKR